MRRERLIQPTKPAPIVDTVMACKFFLVQSPGLQACQTQRRQALLFHPFRDFYAATGLCRDASNGT
ncbi:hypothetical protein NX035_22435, partial [Escherichia coli]|nr:hypothetical protein [Escherichia coli]